VDVAEAVLQVGPTLFKAVVVATALGLFMIRRDWTSMLSTYSTTGCPDLWPLRAASDHGVGTLVLEAKRAEASGLTV
jgi:hypothetical protein